MAKTTRPVPLDRIIRRNVRYCGKQLEYALFPVLTREVVFFLTLWTVLDAINMNFMNFAPKIAETIVYGLLGKSLLAQTFYSLLIGTITALTVTTVIRCSLTLMLYYNGWLFEEIGKEPSLATKIFMVTLGFISKRATFFAYQGILPWLMPPKVEDTIEKYLLTMKPILSEKEHLEMSEQAEEFKRTVASGLQNKLWMKWAMSKNYLSDWWKEVVYMRYRDSLIRTNVGCADVIYQKTTSIQAARAAYVTLNRQHFCNDIFKTEKMKPVSLGGIPLCAQQYAEYYRTLRIPSETSDKMIRLPDAKHIAVYHKGCWYKIDIFHGKRMIKPSELEKSFQMILDSKDHKSQSGEKYLSALTIGPRDLWAKIRNEKFSKGGVNQESLTFIENSLEIVFLDEEERFFDENDSTKYGREYARALHGDGYMLWCDKPSVYIFSKNGRFSSNAEHSPCDAMIYVQVREYIKYHEEFEHPYGPDGHCIGPIEHVPQPERLCWDMDKETLEAIDEAYKSSKHVADDFSNSNIVFTEYGKDFMKKARVSPDAYIQMALQMAYYKDQGKFEQTYEPAVMRLFKEGRTETVRSCSVWSCDFVRTMLKKEVDSKKKLEKLKEACDHHQDYYRTAMAGKGVDRHLFALYVVARYLEIKVPFLDNVFKRNWSLSTSQTPQHQMVEYAKALNKEPALFWPAGGFACPDGSNYGVCYTIGTTGDRMSFHVTTWNSMKNTNADRFLNHILESLREIRQVVEEATSKKT
ncbi:hypothetical protein GCK72_019148 [Caenorhabditis remanei]|uniref:carnitine O-palmitoyltransferase n=1 Tax=Caenorhabditis remanei TaxID=31234 RepID=A0A6A5GD43_CAERE|nr:hypothetical protein GCK72_019148 [Caenorhabditis remanei]KAF1752593.1 hypothetical protein GCK72_019148 [Caenorhabditis remanei]